MAIESAHKHLGFKIAYDALIPIGTIVINPVDLDALHMNTLHTASEFSGSFDDAAADMQINATQVGPLSGPASGTGPLIPIGTAVTKEILPFNPKDERPNAISAELEAGQDDKATTVVGDQNLAPYPTGDMPAVPTTVDPPAVEPIVPEATTEYAPEAEEVPLPEHPAIEIGPPEEVFADSDGKTIGYKQEDGSFAAVRENPFPPTDPQHDLTGHKLSDYR